MNVESKLLSVNFAKGRGGMRPDVIVVHIQEGTMAGTDAWFRNPQSKVSAHYGVGRDGSVVRWVHDLDTAWHAGRVQNPTAQIVKERPGLNPNTYTIGIECEGKADQETTVLQLTALGELVRQLCFSLKIPATRKHVIGHREIFSGKTCPGKIDVDQIVSLARIGPAPDNRAEVHEHLDEIERRMNRIREIL